MPDDLSFDHWRCGRCHRLLLDVPGPNHPHATMGTICDACWMYLHHADAIKAFRNEVLHGE